MISHYLTIALRAFARSKSYTALNIAGLTLGITCALTILLYVHDELTYDSNHHHAEGIYRLNSGWRSTTDGTSNMYAATGYVVGDVLMKEFPQIDQLTRLRRFWDMRIEKPATDEFFLEYLYFAEPNIFEVFTLPLIAGDANDALSTPNSLVVTKKAALKYFNRTDVLGEHLRWLGHDTVDFQITGVMEDYPDNTHLKADLITTLSPPTDMRGEWFEYGYYTYFTLQENAHRHEVESRIKDFTKGYADDIEKEIGFTQEHSVIPFSRIHLHSNLPGELETNSNASYVFIFLIVGIFIMVMACINFMNLATARSMTRAREIGIRKVVGAVKFQLVKQFLGEAFLMTVVASALSIGAAWTLLPIVNEFSGKNLQMFNNGSFWILLVSIMLFVALLAGSYPAFFLSAFKPVDTLKGNFRSSGRGILLRKGLVIFQFSISIMLIAGTLIIMRHLQYLRNKELGFDKERVLTITGVPRTLKDQVLNISGVKAASFSNRVPGVSVGGRTIINGWSADDQQVVLGQLAVDHDFVDLYGFELIAGRNFSEDIPSDLNEAFIVNESALERLQITSAEEAIGHRLWLDEWGGKKGTIIGVLKDFHFIGVNSGIEPFSMFILPGGARFLSVKIDSDDLHGVVGQIESLYQSAVPGRPFEYSFLDQAFDRQYQAEDRFMTIFSYFAMVAILIGCLGLYGLAMFTAGQRTKEVGVRKVLGASEQSILGLLTADFLKLVTVSVIVAIPVAWWGMEKWLRGFPYREKIDPVIFLITGFIVIAISMITVGYQAVLAAKTNPVKALRMD